MAYLNFRSKNLKTLSYYRESQKNLMNKRKPQLYLLLPSEIWQSDYPTWIIMNVQTSWRRTYKSPISRIRVFFDPGTCSPKNGNSWFFFCLKKGGGEGNSRESRDPKATLLMWVQEGDDPASRDCSGKRRALGAAAGKEPASLGGILRTHLKSKLPIQGLPEVEGPFLGVEVLGWFWKLRNSKPCKNCGIY